MSRRVSAVLGGELYDPQNGVRGELRDIWICDGKICDPESLSALERDLAERIDASGCWVLPGGIDMHAHIAGKVNSGRKLCPSDHRARVWPGSGAFPSGSGFATPTSHATAHIYAEMGYTTAVEAASSPLAARHVQEEFQDMPIIDKAMLILFANNEFVLEKLAAGEDELARAYVAWTLGAVGGYGVKAVNPGGADNWKWGGNVHAIDDSLRAFNTTPRRVISFLANTVQQLGLPHPLHLHGLNLGLPESAATTITIMEAFEGHPGHLCHLQFLGYQGRAKGNGLASAAAPLIEALERHPNLTFDVGQIVFGAAVTMTSDSPLEYHLHRLTGRKWVGADLENESGSGIVPLDYKRKSSDGATQWITGLELFLLAPDPWRLCLTTDHPNAGPLYCYPQVIALLMDSAFRQEELKRVNSGAADRSLLKELDRQYSLYEIAIITRAAPARILGLPNKGHLGFGADADIAVYRPCRQGTRPCSCPENKRCRRLLDRAEWTIKGGAVVVRDGKVVADPDGLLLSVTPGYDASVLPHIREFFRDYYTIAFDNFAIEDDGGRSVIPCRR